MPDITELRDEAVAAGRAAIAATERSSRVSSANPVAWADAQARASAARKRHIAANDAYLNAAFAEMA